MTGRFAALWSGGKDCALAVARAREQGIDVTAFVSVVDAATERVRFHGTRAAVLAEQAAAAGAELRLVRASWSGMEAALAAEFAALRRAGIEGVVMGNVHLADVRAWYEERTTAAGLVHVEPVWGLDPAALVTEYVARGGRALVTCVDTARLDGAWLGRELTGPVPGVDAAGELGEYHTLAIAGPPFARPVECHVAGPVELEPGYAQLDVANGRSP